MPKSLFTPKFVIQPQIVHNVRHSSAASKRSRLLLSKNEWITNKRTKSAYNCRRSLTTITVWRATNHWEKDNLWWLHLFRTYNYSDDGQSSCAWMLVWFWWLIWIRIASNFISVASFRYSETVHINSLDVMDYRLERNDLFIGIAWTLYYRCINWLLRNDETVLDLSYYCKQSGT